eukprot:gene35-3431_t
MQAAVGRSRTALFVARQLTQRRTWFGFGQPSKFDTNPPKPWYQVEPEDDTDVMDRYSTAERKDRIAIRRKLMELQDQGIESSEEVAADVADLVIKWKDRVGAAALVDNSEFLSLPDDRKAALEQFLEETKYS